MCQHVLRALVLQTALVWLIGSSCLVLAPGGLVEVVTCWLDRVLGGGPNSSLHMNPALACDWLTGCQCRFVCCWNQPQMAKDFQGLAGLGNNCRCSLEPMRTAGHCQARSPAAVFSITGGCAAALHCKCMHLQGFGSWTASCLEVLSLSGCGY